MELRVRVDNSRKVVPFGSQGDRFATPWRVNPGPGDYENKTNDKA